MITKLNTGSKYSLTKPMNMPTPPLWLEVSGKGWKNIEEFDKVKDKLNPLKHRLSQKLPD